MYSALDIVLILLFQFGCLFFFTCLIAVVRIFNTKLKNRGESGRLVFFILGVKFSVFLATFFKNLIHPFSNYAQLS